MRRDDPFAGLSGAQRRAKEREDVEFIQRVMQGRMLANREALAIAGNTFAGSKTFKAAAFAPYEKGEPVAAVICARIDLDHPIYFPDNLFAECIDCGCDLQYRPDVPSAGDKLCICCTARRLREERA
jgi:hypothetical protein